MSDPESVPECGEGSRECGEPVCGPSWRYASPCHGDDIAALQELPLTDELLERLRVAGF